MARPSKNKRIKKAVENKKPMTFTYTDQHGSKFKQKSRRVKVEGAALGQTRAGHQALRAFDPKKGEWRLFRQDGIKNLKVDDKEWTKERKGRNKQGDRGLTNIKALPKGNKKKK